MAGRRRGALLGEACGGVLGDGLQEPVAHGAVGGGRGDDEGLVDEGAEHVGHVRRGCPGGGADGFDGGEVAAAREDGEAGEHGAFAGVEEVPGPVDDGAQGLLAGQHGAAAGGQEPEAVVEAVGDLARGEQPQPRGGEFDGERETVEAAADLGDGLGLRGGREAGADGGGAFAEEAARGGLGEGFDGAEDFAGDTERFAAGRDDREAGAAFEEGLREVRGGADDVLAVVEEEEHPARGAVLGEPGEDVVVLAVGRDAELLGPGAAQDGLAPADRAEHGGGDALGVGDGGEFGEPDAVRGAVAQCLGGLLAQPRLAGAAGPEERHEP